MGKKKLACTEMIFQFALGTTADQNQKESRKCLLNYLRTVISNAIQILRNIHTNLLPSTFLQILTKNKHFASNNSRPTIFLKIFDKKSLQKWHLWRNSYVMTSRRISSNERKKGLCKMFKFQRLLFYERKKGVM